MTLSSLVISFVGQGIMALIIAYTALGKLDSGRVDASAWMMLQMFQIVRVLALLDIPLAENMVELFSVKFSWLTFDYFTAVSNENFGDLDGDAITRLKNYGFESLKYSANFLDILINIFGLLLFFGLPTLISYFYQKKRPTDLSKKVFNILFALFQIVMMRYFSLVFLDMMILGVLNYS